MTFIRTKIIATLGPASSSEAGIGRLIEAGADVFRLNFSHGTLEQHGETLCHVRAACRRLDATAAVMGDLCGPKIRVGAVAGDRFELAEGATIDIVATEVVGTAERISTNRPEIVEEVGTGHRVLIDDGLVRLRVSEKGQARLRCICETGGWISSRKGINLPDSDVGVSAITGKDRCDLAWALAQGVDFVALSFVRRADELEELRTMIREAGSSARVIAKVETPQAIDRLEEIVEAADIVLCARGDLGVEMDLTEVPLIQKRMARLCQRTGTPIIVATQMLQSMVETPTATRAEISDVANAILDAADCVMLSAETAVGKYPVEAVRTMMRVAEHTERFLAQDQAQADVFPAHIRPVTTAVAHGAALLARQLDPKLVAVWTEQGNTARILSKLRLGVPVVGLSPDEAVCRRMAIYYGVVPMRMKRSPRTADMLREVDGMLKDRGMVKTGDRIVVIAGTHLDEPGATNALLIHLVGE